MPLEHVAHLRWHPFIGVSFHDAFFIETQTPMKNYPYLTLGVLNGLGIGAQPSDDTMRGPFDIPLMAQGSDAGLFVPHIPFVLPPTDALLAITIPLGESTIQLGSGTNIMPCENLIWGRSEQTIGACIPPFLPISYNIGCQDYIPAPFDLVIAPNTVLVGITFVDIVKALASYVILGVGMAVVGQYGGTLVKKYGGALVPKKVKGAGEYVSKKAKGAGEYLIPDRIKRRRKAKSAKGALKIHKKVSGAHGSGDKAARKARDAGLSETEEKAARKRARNKTYKNPEEDMKARREAERAMQKEIQEKNGKEVGEKARLEAFERSRKTGVRESMNDAYEKGYRDGYNRSLTIDEGWEVQKAGFRAEAKSFGARYRKAKQEALEEALELKVQKARRKAFLKALTTAMIIPTFTDSAALKKAIKTVVFKAAVKRLLFKYYIRTEMGRDFEVTREVAARAEEILAEYLSPQKPMDATTGQSQAPV